MKTVVICGSRQFKKEIREFAVRLRKAGVVVYEPIPKIEFYFEEIKAMEPIILNGDLLKIK